MAAVVIVGVEPLVEAGRAFGLAEVGPGVGPFLDRGPVEPLDLPVGLRPIGAGAFVRDRLAQRRGESV